MTIGERIERIRKDAGLTQVEFADAVGVSDATISRAEKGTQEVRKTVKLSICNAFRVNLDWLETGEGEPYMPQDVSAGTLLASLVSVLEDNPALFKAVQTASETMTVGDWKKLNDFVETLGGKL